MKCVLLVCLLLQAVYAAKNISVSIDVPRENPADVSYVEGKAPEELKAGPVKTNGSVKVTKSETTTSKEIISHAAFIRSSNREIPKDDEIENEEFERFIKKYHSQPTIETVFVSTSPSPPAEDSEEIEIETNNTTESQAEVFKSSPAKLQTFERSVAHPTLTSHILQPPDHHPTYAIVSHEPHDASLHQAGSASFSGSDGYVFQAHGGAAAGNEGLLLQANGGHGGGQILLTDAQGGGGGEQQYYQYADFVPRTFNIAQNAVKTKTYEIRRPAIQRHYYDIEERVIVRPAGSVIVELDRPVAKVPTGETVVAVGGLTGQFVGNGIQQSTQGISFANAFGLNGAGGQGGVLVQQSDGSYVLQGGSGLTFASSGGSLGGSIGGIQQSQGAIGGGLGVIGIQQAQGAIGGGQGVIGIQQGQGAIGGGLGGIGIQQAQGGIGGGLGGIGIQQAQGGIGGGQGGIGIQQAQGAIGGGQGGVGIQQAQGAIGGGQGGVGIQQAQGAIGGGQGGIGIQQAQGAIGGGQGGIGIQQAQGGIGGGQGGVGIQQAQGATGGGQGGIQQSQSGISISTTTQSPNGAPSTTVTIGTQQQQGTAGGSGFQQSQSGITVTTTPAPAPGPSVTQTSSTTGFGGTGGGFTGIGIQQSQGGIGGGGIQQSQSGITVSTTPAPNNGPTSSTTNIFVTGPGTGGRGGISYQGGFYEGGGVYSTTGAPFFQSTTPFPNGGGYSGIGFQQSQGGLSQNGGSFGAGFQQQQGGVTSTTGAPFFPSTTPFPSGGGYSGIGYQQSQGGISQNGGSFGAGFQQSQGGVTSTTPAPFFPSTTPSPNAGGFSGIGFQQSQGGVSQNGGSFGAGFQQSQGGIYSTTPPPYLPPPALTPTVLIGRPNSGFSGAGFQQSQGGIGVGQGGLTGAGFQQSQGGVGISQGGGGFAGFQQSQGGIGLSQGGLSGTGFQQSQGGIGIGNGGEFIYSTTSSSPSYSVSGSRSIILRQQPGGGYPVVSTTTGGPIIISTLNQHGHNGNSFIIQGDSNLHSKGSVSTTTTTERSYSVSQGASAYAKSGSLQDVSKDVKPFKIAVGEPDFSYPSYVEITSNGSPLGHLTQQSYVQDPSQHYPRMRYQGQLLTGEVRVDDGLTENQESQHQGYGALSAQHQNQEHVETTTTSPQEEHSALYQSGFSNSQQSNKSSSQNQHQIVGSSQQPIQLSQISSSTHQQSDQVHQHNIPRPISQPIVEQHVSQQNSSHQLSSQQNSAKQQGHPQQIFHQYSVQQQQPIQNNVQQQYYMLELVPITPIHQDKSSLISNKQPAHPNLVAQIIHKEKQQQQQQQPQQQHQQQSQVQTYHQQIEHQTTEKQQQQQLQQQQQHQQQHQQQSQVHTYHQQIEHHTTESTHSKQEHVTEAVEEPVEVSEIHSSTHQLPTLFQQQVAPTANTLEPYSSGSRQYKQRGAPQKYTQDQSLNTATSEHTVVFNNNLEHTSARSQNVEIPPVVEEKSSKNVESTTVPIAVSSTINTHRVEQTTQSQHQTYAQVLAQGKPGILYAPPKPVVLNHSPIHKQHFLRFSADGSSLFSPSGRQLHLVYSDSPQPIYPHQSQTQSIPAPAPVPINTAVNQQISVTKNKGYQIQAQLPITRQSQIQLNAGSNKPASASEPQITRSQSQHAESHQTSAHYEAISSTTTVASTKDQSKLRGPQKYRNEQTHGAITLRSGRTYGDHRVIASTPAPSDGGAASESVQTRRIVVNHPFQTVQEVVEREPFTNIHQVTVNAPAKQVLAVRDGLQEGQQKSAALRAPSPYKVVAVAQLNHPKATLNFQHNGAGAGSH